MGYLFVRVCCVQRGLVVAGDFSILFILGFSEFAGDDGLNNAMYCNCFAKTVCLFGNVLVDVFGSVKLGLGCCSGKQRGMVIARLA